MASNNDPKVIRDVLVQAFVASDLTEEDKLLGISEVEQVYRAKLEEQGEKQK